MYADQRYRLESLIVRRKRIAMGADRRVEMDRIWQLELAGRADLRRVFQNLSADARWEMQAGRVLSLATRSVFP